MSSTAEHLVDRAAKGEHVPVTCVCGYASVYCNLVLVDRYTNDMPPVPKGNGHWLEIWDDGVDDMEGPAAQCPECDRDWAWAEMDDFVVERHDDLAAVRELAGRDNADVGMQALATAGRLGVYAEDR